MLLRRFVVVLVVALVLVPAAAARSSSAARAVSLEHQVAADRAAVSRLQAQLAVRRRRLASGSSQLEQLLPRLSWLDAVDVVSSSFGSSVAGWERSCSQPGSEGGWGRWVPNTGGSGAGGWLQFMSGTFYGVIDRAIASARSSGLPVVPPRVRSWYSPLGQALAGAQMLADGRRGEWTGWGC